MVIIAYRRTQGWAGPGGSTVMTGRVPPTVYFKLLWLSRPPPPPFLVNTQSWSRYLHPHKHKTNPPPHLHLSTPPHHLYLWFSLKSSVPFYKLFLYHTSISHGDQYRCNSLDFPKSARLRALALITAIDSFSFGRSPTYFDIFSTRSQKQI